MNIFEVFLPQLLRYPNPSDPLNGDASALLMREPKRYEQKVQGKITFFFCQQFRILTLFFFFFLEYVTRYASKAALDANDDESSSDDEMSSVGSFSDDDEAVGKIEV